ncbi:MAG: WbqC family protein [Bacteroidota bacterium]
MPILIETAYLPPVGYMSELILSGDILFEVYETYHKQTYRNHCVIYGPNGEQKLTIPVIKVNGNHTLTKDIRISDHQPWQKIHWRSIYTAYNNSPFFLYYQDELIPFFEKRFEFLADFNMELLQAILRLIHCSCRTGLTGLYEKRPSGITDLRNGIIAGKPHVMKSFPPYVQVFEPRHGFIQGLSILDALFNLGPETAEYLKAQ